MNAQGILHALRNGHTLSVDEVTWMGRHLAGSDVSDAQAGAFAMGVCTQGLNPAARTALTLAMRDSGQVLSWALDGPVVDKHSTGGVGDCVSLVLAPALAAAGVYVPMISGRGLGHTGGTLDKLEAIPGLSTQVDEAQLRKIVGNVGCAIVGTTHDIAPADKRLYAIRDVTGTVESIDLITASILSKKLAAGLDGLVLDVKTGSGAFMGDMGDAQALACALVETANQAGCKTTALITDMNQPLAKAMGNALEVMDVMETLTGRALDPALGDLSADLGGALLALLGVAETAHDGASMIAEKINTGAAAECFGRMISAQGGPADFTDRWADRLAAAPYIKHVLAPDTGYVKAINGVALGNLVVGLGGGRLVENARIDPAVGLSDIAGLGDYLEKGEPLAEIHARNPAEAEQAEKSLLKAIEMGEDMPDLPPTVYESIF